MFQITKDPQFTHDVPVLIPVDDGHEEKILRCRFRVRGADDLAQHDLASVQGTEDYLRAIVVRFEDVMDETGKLLEPSEALTNDLLALPYVRVAVIRRYTEAMVKARQGN